LKGRLGSGRAGGRRYNLQRHYPHSTHTTCSRCNLAASASTPLTPSAHNFFLLLPFYLAVPVLSLFKRVALSQRHCCHRAGHGLSAAAAGCRVRIPYIDAGAIGSRVTGAVASRTHLCLVSLYSRANTRAYAAISLRATSDICNQRAHRTPLLGTRSGQRRLLPVRIHGILFSCAPGSPATHGIPAHCAYMPVPAHTLYLPAMPITYSLCLAPHSLPHPFSWEDLYLFWREGGNIH